MLILRGHGGPVRCVAYAPDGRTLASGGDDGRVRVWDLTTGTQRHALAGHTDKVRAVAFAPDGQELASGGWDESLLRWHPARGKRVGVIEPEPVGNDMLAPSRAIWSLAYSPAGRVLTAGRADGVIGLHVRGGRPTLLKGHQWPVYGLAFTADGERLASAGHDKTVQLWSVRGFPGMPPRQLATLKGHTDWVRSVSFHPDGERFASGSDDSTVRLWGTGERDREALGVLRGHDNSVWSVAFLRGGDLLASASWDGSVVFWDAASGAERARFDWRIGRVHAVAFAPDGMTAAAGGESGEVVVWDIDDL
jgi:WD40 repeat protein